MPFPDIDKYKPLGTYQINRLARKWDLGLIISSRDIPEENDWHDTMLRCFPTANHENIHTLIAATFDDSGEEFGCAYGSIGDLLGMRINNFPMITAFSFLSKADLDRVIDVATRLREAVKTAYREVAPVEGDE